MKIEGRKRVFLTLPEQTSLKFTIASVYEQRQAALFLPSEKIKAYKKNWATRTGKELINLARNYFRTQN